MIRRIIGRLTAAATSIVLYIPVIAGLITPMMWLLPAWYFSWQFLSYIIPFSEFWHGLFTIPFGDSPDLFFLAIAAIFRLTQIVAFCAGLFLLCYGLFALAKARVHHDGLVTHGPYRWIRHPQHLGILLMLLLLVSLPWRTYEPLLYPACRPGDVISILLIAFLLVLVADLEEHRLTAEYEDVYSQYQADTPFLLPIRIRIPESLRHHYLERGRPLRYLVAFLLYWLFLVLLSYCFTFFPLIFTR